MAGIEAVIRVDAVFAKDPADKLDFRRDWSTWLGDLDTISTSAFAVPAGITKESEANGDDSATVWLSGGTDGEDYTVTNEIETNGGRIAQYSFLIRVRNR